MSTYAVLLRGINVGGKNKIPMADLRASLEDAGFQDVETYIQSGNVILRSDLDARALAETIEALLPTRFPADGAPVRALAVGHDAYRAIVAGAPHGFGDDPATYRYNTVFLLGVGVDEALAQITTREGVDAVWPGPGVLYFRNSVAQASKSHLSRIAGKPVYASLTIRNWNTTRKLLELLDARSALGDASRPAASGRTSAAPTRRRTPPPRTRRRSRGRSGCSARESTSVDATIARSAERREHHYSRFAPVSRATRRCPMCTDACTTSTVIAPSTATCVRSSATAITATRNPLTRSPSRLRRTGA